MKRACFLVARSLADIALGIGLLWTLGLWLYRSEALIVSVLAAAGFFVLPPLACALRRRKSAEEEEKPRSLLATNPLLKRSALRFLLWILLLLNIGVFAALNGPQHVAWQTSWARAPQFTQEGDILAIDNIRDFRYRTETDFDVAYRQETYDLGTLTGADFGECHWDGMEAVCHTMISFAFADGRHLVVSAETRLPEGEDQNAIGGLYKRYGILYVFGTEEDIFALRTNYRHEDLSLYPLKVTPEQARALLESFVRLAADAEARQTPYNTVTDNCSSGLVRVFRSLAPDMPARYDLLPLHNSSISKLIYRHGGMKVRPGESFEALSQRCYLGYDLAKGDRESYSKTIREKRESEQP